MSGTKKQKVLSWAANRYRKDEGGYYCFEYLDAQALSYIADDLDAKNKEWDRQVKIELYSGLGIMEHLTVEYTAFGKTKLVKGECHNMFLGDTPEHILWVDRGEDMYGLMSPSLKGKKVVVVHGKDWRAANETT